MKHETQYKGSKITVQLAEEEDWKGRAGYEAIVEQEGCETMVTFTNYPNVTQALSAAKKAIDNRRIPSKKK